jgi:hypothetical protein
MNIGQSVTKTYLKLHGWSKAPASPHIRQKTRPYLKICCQSCCQSLGANNHNRYRVHLGAMAPRASMDARRSSPFSAAVAIP